MTKSNLFLLILSVLLFISGQNKAQIVIKGRILTPAGLPVSYVPIVLKPISKDNILTYSMTSEEGRYVLSYDGKLDSLVITISGFNIASQSKMIKAITQTVDFKIEEKAIELKEVKVKATKIWGAHDTINYLVSSFSDKKDFVIGDVLRKMPGISIKGGAIQYNGKPINKFYIENLDMLQGRYGIAVNNISVKDISTIQVLQNHQPIKALAKSSFSDDAAINLKLKDGAKGTFSIMAQLGIGALPLLHENELTGMYFAKTRQFMCTFKENNSGEDLSNELKSFTGGVQISGANMLNVQMPSSPGISQKRYLFNNSNAASINNLIKFKSGSQFTFNLIYLNDYQTQQSTAVSSYYLPGDSILKINEKLHSVKNINRFETKLQYNINEEKYYLNNDFNIVGTWERSIGEIITDQTIKQNLYRPSFAVSNNFKLVKKKEDGKGVEFSSRNSYMSNPETLILRPGMYNNIFTEGSYYSALGQQVSLNTFQSSSNITLLSSLVFNKIRVDPLVGFNVVSQHLNSELGPLDETENTFYPIPDSMRNNLDWLKSELNLSLNANYSNSEKFYVYLSLPMSYKMIKLTNEIPGEKQNNDYLFIEPSVNIYYKINSNFSISSGYSFYNQLGNIQTLYPGYILQSYRNMNAYNNKLSKAQTNGGNIGLSYKDLVPALFIRMSLTYNHTKRDVLYGQDFNGIMNTTYAIGQGNVSENRSISGFISKGYDFWRLVFTLESMYGTFSSEQIRQNQLIRYNNEGGNISGNVVMKPTKWMSLSYKGTWGENRGKIKNGESLPSIRTTVNYININFFLLKDLNLNLNYEQYRNSAAQGNKFISFMDLGAGYTWNKARISLDWTNIFDTKNYTTSYYNNISAYQYQYEIRPASILFKVKLKLR